VLAGSLLLFGFLVAQDPTTYRAPGYGRLSFNLLAPINPMAFGSILLPALPITDNGQFEGYNYLGLGIIAILVAALAVRPRLMLWVRDPRLLPLVGLAIVCTAAAASSTVTLGSLTLLHIELPRAFGVLTESMRISGRLFWPAHYLLIAAALSATFHAWKPPYRAAILAAALALQLADLGPLRARVQAIGRQLGPDPLQSDAWKQLGRDHENLIVVPAFQCAPELTPGGHPGFEVFGKLASAQRMRTNSYYAARYTQREMIVHCVDLPRAVLTDALDSRSAYVVSDGVRTLLELSSMASHRCETHDGYHVCTAAASPAEADRRRPDAVPYAFGEQLDFTTEGNARKYMTHGWATVPLVDGTWTVGPVAALLLGIEDTATDSLLLTAELRGFVTDAHRRLDADVVVNGQTVERWTFRQGRLDTKRSARIPASVIGGRRVLDVQFRVLNPQAPAYVGEGYDFRFVGLNIRGLVLHREQ
jgi:hypothetical protein